MAETVVLTWLKFVGLAIGLASTFWGMTQNTTSTDDAGRKRLTPAGHVALALAMGSFLVAAASQGFEVLAKQVQKRESDIAAGLKAAQEARAEAQALRSEQAQRHTIDLANLMRAEALARAAEERAALAEGRVIDLRTAEAERERDLRLSRDLNLSARNNLRSSEQILGQVQRAANPIGAIRLEFAVDVPLTSASRAMISDLMAYYPDCVICEYGQGSINREEARQRGMTELWNLLRGTLVRIALVNRASNPTDPQTIRFDEKPISGDLEIATGPAFAVVHYDAAEPVRLTLVYEFDSRVENPTRLSKTERMASTNDLLTSDAAILLDYDFPGEGFGWLMQHTGRAQLSVESAGRRFVGNAAASRLAGKARRFALRLEETAPQLGQRPIVSAR